MSMHKLGRKSVYRQNFKFIVAMVSEFRFSKEEEKNTANLRKSCFPVFRTLCKFFLHLDVLRKHIELKLKMKTEISLCMVITQNNALPSLYTQYYCTV